MGCDKCFLLVVIFVYFFGFLRCFFGVGVDLGVVEEFFEFGYLVLVFVVDVEKELCGVVSVNVDGI